MTATASFQVQPPENRISKGVVSAHGYRLAGDIYILSGEGTPVNGAAGTGTGGGWAQKGSMYIDSVGGGWYANTGTKASATWTQVTIP